MGELCTRCSLPTDVCPKRSSMRFTIDLRDFGPSSKAVLVYVLTMGIKRMCVSLGIERVARRVRLERNKLRGGW